MFRARRMTKRERNILPVCEHRTQECNDALGKFNKLKEGGGTYGSEDQIKENGRAQKTLL